MPTDAVEGIEVDACGVAPAKVANKSVNVKSVTPSANTIGDPKLIERLVGNRERR
ncbi:MAG: hypothetical protein JWO11_4314 [Nocardioides sp.]|nr:hypothetical protein [Nocardioides sp.]